MRTHIEVIVIAQPSRFRESLHLLLTSIPQIEKIHLADDVGSALARNTVPTVIIVDADMAEGSLHETLTMIKTSWPRARQIILLDDDPGSQADQIDRADFLLYKGFPAAKFIELIEVLLSN
jgi:DNA-binding NarL/FixJ family response regulator